MPEQRESSKGGREATRFAEAVETTNRFATVCLSYEQARRDGEAAIRKQSENAYREYAQAVGDAQLDAQKRYEEAARDYWSAVQDSESEQDARDRFMKTDRKYQDAIREIGESTQKRVEEAERIYTSRVDEARVNGQKLSLQAYRDYLRSVQELWSRIDVDAVADAYALTSMNQQTW